MKDNQTTDELRKQLSQCGTYGGKLSTYVRMVCRSRIDDTEADALDIARRLAISELKDASSKGLTYGFVAEHTALLTQFNDDDVLKIIESLMERDTSSPFSLVVPTLCPFQTAHGNLKLAKGKCCTCPIPKKVIRELKKIERHENTNDTTHTETPALKPSPFKSKTKKE